MAILKHDTFISGNLNVGGTLYVTGGIVQTVQEDLKIKDKLIELASGSDEKITLEGAGIQFGQSNLNVYITYSSQVPGVDTGSYGSTERLIVRPQIEGSIDSASHANEVQWNSVTNSPLFPTISYVSGVFTASNYVPTSSRYSDGEKFNSIEIRVPAYAEHVGAVDTGSFTEYSRSHSASFCEYSQSTYAHMSASFSKHSASFCEYSQSTSNYLSASFSKHSASFCDYSASHLAEFQAYSASASTYISESLTVYSASTADFMSASFSKHSASFCAYSASASTTLIQTVTNQSASIIGYVTSSMIRHSASVAQWRSGSTSSFGGTASYASNGPFLHITGGVVTGSTTFNSSVNIKGDSIFAKSVGITGSFAVKGTASFLGTDTTASVLHVQGKFSQGHSASAIGSQSHAEGWGTKASGNQSHAEGESTEASGKSSHAEGIYTTSSGQYSHAEGMDTLASGEGSHAQGKKTVASGQYAFAAGSESVAIGVGSAVFGNHTIASGNFQTVVGRYNELDTQNQYAFIVGAGSGSYVSSSGAEVNQINSNALAVRWDGNIDMMEGGILNGTASYALCVQSEGNAVSVAYSLEPEPDEFESRARGLRSSVYFDEDGSIVFVVPD